MSAELIKLPNFKLKILKRNIDFVPDFLYFPIFKNKNFLSTFDNIKPDSEDIDILIIIFHLYFTFRKKDGLLYINTDDILTCRSVKQNKSGYKKEVRNRIDKKIKNLAKSGLYTIIDYKMFNSIIDFNENYLENIEKIIQVDKKLLALNPVKKSWHKIIGLYLIILKNTATSKLCTIQIKKLVNIITIFSSISSFFPFQIRQRFEDTLDELNQMNIFKGWHYKNIDEEVLNSKNWLYFWKLLSIRIKF